MTNKKSPHQLLETYRKFDIYSRKKNEYYLSYDKAILFINECEQNNVAILGIEGFEVYTNTLVARDDMIMDASPRRDYAQPPWNTYRKKTNAGAKYFLNLCREEGAGLNLGFCFVLISEEDY